MDRWNNNFLINFDFNILWVKEWLSIMCSTSSNGSWWSSLLLLSCGDLMESVKDTSLCFWITSHLSRIKMRQDLPLNLFILNMMFLNLTNWIEYANRSNKRHYRYWSILRTGSYSIKAFQFQPWWKSRCPDSFYEWDRRDSLLSLFLYLSLIKDN